MALQHLRSSTANKRPVPGNMSDGQLGINTNLASPGLFFKDTNGDLVKVGPVHVGTTAPNASPAAGGTAGNSVGEQWLDTTGGTYVFKVWDGSAWRSESGTFVDVNGDVMTGALGIIAGSAGSPGLYVSGDANTGLYSPGSDQLALATGGTGRLFVDATGKVTVNQATDGVPSINIESDNDGRSRTILRFTDTDVATAANQPLGVIQFFGSDTSGAGAGIKSTIGAYSESANGDSYLTFSTATSALNNQECLRITSDRYVRLASGTGGIQFNGDTAAANALDDYEEGTWTPTLAGATTAGTYETTFASGWYTKIGRQVTVQFRINLAGSITGGGVGFAVITGLPFNTSTDNYANGGSVLLGSVNFNDTAKHLYLYKRSTTSGQLVISEIFDNAAPQDVGIADFAASSIIAGSLVYFVS